MSLISKAFEPDDILSRDRIKSGACQYAMGKDRDIDLDWECSRIRAMVAVGTVLGTGLKRVSLSC
jgi:hypothetical protein